MNLSLIQNCQNVSLVKLGKSMTDCGPQICEYCGFLIRFVACITRAVKKRRITRKCTATLNLDIIFTQGPKV